MNSRNSLLLRTKLFLKNRLPDRQSRLLRRLVIGSVARVSKLSLPQLAQLYGLAKWGPPSCMQPYEDHFAPWRNRKLTLIEIGIGGYSDPKAGGNSLRMWKTFFRKGSIYGVDIADKSPHDEPRIRTFRGDQSDEAFLRRVIAETGTPDIIIDDGSHINDHVIKTFQILFPLLAEDGFYTVEDTQTAYWPDYGGSSDDLCTSLTSMCLFKKLIDGLNYEEFIRPGYAPSYFDEHIVAMHFYHNLVFVRKGSNKAGSNLIRNNMPPADAGGQGPCGTSDGVASENPG
ncbi:MAG TPA: hypothetical protein VNZ64_03150 [Candidatus Acidoferrum sp.]|jgi:hypothetical protein|nr:hypothetical protein [Candidatus Acidoferrum sp.]